MRANNLRIALLTAVLAFVPVVAEATIAKAMGFDEKVENAAAIVVGKVVSQRSQWDAARSWILTYSTFRIEKTLKGQAGQEITIVTPGGQVGDVAQDVVGVPRFREGEEHVVFVRNSQAGPTVLYLEQGAYRLEKNDRGDRIVNPLVSSAVLVDTQRGIAVAPEHPRPLREFEDGVRDSIRRREIRMKMLEQQKREAASFTNQLKKNWVLVTLALLGALLATWQIAKRA